MIQVIDSRSSHQESAGYKMDCWDVEIDGREYHCIRMVFMEHGVTVFQAFSDMGLACEHAHSPEGFELADIT